MKILKDLVRRVANQTLKPFNVCITNISYLQQIQKRSWESGRAVDDLELLMELPDRSSSQLLRTLRRSKSELRQDLVVLSELDFKRNGFFVDFGAMDGVVASNSYILEKDFGWRGILVEPAKCWHKDLRNNRNSHIETNCVWRDSESVVTFNEVEFSGLSDNRRL